MAQGMEVPWPVVLLVIVGPVAFRKASAWWQSLRAPSSKAAFTPRGPVSPLAGIPVTVIGPGGKPVQALISPNPTQYLALFIATATIVFHLTRIFFETDLFLATGLPITAPITDLRSRVSTKSYYELGWKNTWGEEGLALLLNKLGSFDGRVTYLSYGAEPLLQCFFCISHSDYGNYSLVLRSLWFVAHGLLFGALTVPASTVTRVDALLCWATGRPYQEYPCWHRGAWRNLIPWYFGTLAFIRVGVAKGQMRVYEGQGILNHWHRNLAIFESSAVILLLLLILVFPSLGPAPNVHQQILASQGATLNSLQEAASSVQIVSVQNALTKRHPEWQERVKKDWDRSAGPRLNEELLKATDPDALPKMTSERRIGIADNGAGSTPAGRLITEEEFARRTFADLEESARSAGVNIAQERQQAMAYSKLMWDTDEASSPNIVAGEKS